MPGCPHFSRRNFIKTAVLGGAALALPQGVRRTLAAETGGAAQNMASRVALTAGEDRADIAFQGLKPFARQIAAAIGDKRVIIKPNNVSMEKQLAATAAENIEGILEFLKSIGKAGNVIIAESAANGPTLEGFHNFGYDKVAAKYGAKMVDLDQEAFEMVQVFDEADFRPHAMRTSKLLLDRNNFIISAAKMKTHDRILATLSLKNIVVGAPIKTPDPSRNRNGRQGFRNDKPLTHGSGTRGINYNLFALASVLRPDLSVIDGWEGMEGNGPVGGTPVPHRVCVVSPDWLAADRVAIELMGIDFANVGYLNFCADAGMGEANLERIEIVGPAIKDHVRKYQMARNFEKQLIWKEPLKPAPLY